MVRQETKETRARILKTLFEAQVGNKVEAKNLLNKHQIEKLAKIAGRQTLYNNIRQLEVLRWIRVHESSKTWKTNQRYKDHKVRMERFELTEQGLYYAIVYNPDLETKAKESLGFDFKQFKIGAEKGRVQSRLFYLHRQFEIIEHVIENGAPPGWYLTIDLKANQQGLVGYSVRKGTEELDAKLRAARRN